MFLFRNKSYWRYLLEQFQKKWPEGLPYAVSFITATYGLYKLLQELFDKVPTLQDLHWTLRIVVLTLCFALGYLWWLVHGFKSLNCTTHSAGQNRSVSVRIEDMLSRKDGTILIGVSNTLETDRRGKNSIHQQLADLYSKDWLEEVFEAGRQNGVKVGDGTYPYGYTFMGETPDGKSVAFIVMSEWEGDSPNQPPTGDAEKIGTMMKELFTDKSSFHENVGSNCKDQRLYMPLIGMNTAKLGLSKQEYAEWIVRQFLDSGSGQIHHLVIELRPRTLDDKSFDYAALNEHIEFYVKGLHHPNDAMPRPVGHADSSRKERNLI